jgi:TPR repeat protein
MMAIFRVFMIFTAGTIAGCSQSLTLPELLQALNCENRGCVAFREPPADRFWYWRVSNSRNVDDSLSLPRPLFSVDEPIRDPITAIRVLGRDVEQGKSIAQLGLGLAYRLPGANGKPHNWRKAVQWLVSAARQNEPGAMLALAEMFYSGVGLRRDPGMAIKLLEAGKRLGDWECRFFHARMQLVGDGMPRNTPSAIAEFQDLAAMGHLKSHYELGLIFLEGRGSAVKNVVQAVNHIRAAAYWRYAEAQLALGRMYYLGLGVPKDNTEAYRLVYSSAKTRFAPAQRLLSVLDMTIEASVRAEVLRDAEGPDSGFRCGTSFMGAQAEDEARRAKDESPQPVINWNSLLRSALQ